MALARGESTSSASGAEQQTDPADLSFVNTVSDSLVTIRVESERGWGEGRTRCDRCGQAGYSRSPWELSVLRDLERAPGVWDRSDP